MISSEKAGQAGKNTVQLKNRESWASFRLLVMNFQNIYILIVSYIIQIQLNLFN
jgi:hypothetical protein